MVAVVTLAVGAEVSTVVVLSVVVLSVVVPEELELLDVSSSSAQEMTVRLKRDMRTMYKILFIFFISNERK